MSTSLGFFVAVSGWSTPRDCYITEDELKFQKRELDVKTLLDGYPHRFLHEGYSLFVLIDWPSPKTEKSITLNTIRTEPDEEKKEKLYVKMVSTAIEFLSSIFGLSMKVVDKKAHGLDGKQLLAADSCVINHDLEEKYIVVRIHEKGEITHVLFSETCMFHRDLYHRLLSLQSSDATIDVLGGGFLRIDRKGKKIKVWGRSISFGPPCDLEIVRKLLDLPPYSSFQKEVI